MKDNAIKLGAVVLAALLAAGCASMSGTQLKETETLKARLDSLESQVATLTQRLDQATQDQQLAQGQDGGLSAGPASEKTRVSKGATNLIWTVRQTQRALAAAGFYKGTLDGKGGPLTRKALREFQQAHGLKSDGIVGPATSEALARYLEEPRE